MTGPSSERTADADAATMREALETQKVRVGYRGERIGALAALDRLVARNQQLQEALAAAHRLEDSDGQATHYLIYDPACPHCQRHDELRAALASVRARTTEVAWLIERGQPEGLDNPEWYAARPVSREDYEGDWTRDANKACRWETREHAEQALAEIQAGTGLTARAVEHGWLASVRARTPA